MLYCIQHILHHNYIHIITIYSLKQTITDGYRVRPTNIHWHNLKQTILHVTRLFLTGVMTTDRCNNTVKGNRFHTVYFTLSRTLMKLVTFYYKKPPTFNVIPRNTASYLINAHARAHIYRQTDRSIFHFLHIMKITNFKYKIIHQQ